MTELSAPITVTIPLLNTNEPEGLLAALHVQEGQPVRRGDPLFTLETTKATADVEAEQDGYVIGLRLAQGRQVRAGDLFCYLASSPDQTPPHEPDKGPGLDRTVVWTESDSEQPVPEGLRITRPALRLARFLGIDLRILPGDVLVTEAMVEALDPQPVPLAGAIDQNGWEQIATNAAARSSAKPPEKEWFDPTALVIYGGGGHGKSLIDLARQLQVDKLVGGIDDGLPPGSQIMGLPTLGGAAALAELYARGVRLAINAVGGISNLQTRRRVFEILEQAGFACPAVVHPSAVVEPSAELAAGVQVFAHAYVGSEARVGFGAIVNTGAILSHDCVLGEYANISPGAILAGEVKIGAGALVGMGATINLQVRVGERARIGNGATVKADVPANAVVRAGSVWPA